MSDDDLRIKSYVTKEELINMLTNIEFIAIKHLSIELITGFIFKEDESIQPLYKEINID